MAAFATKSVTHQQCSPFTPPGRPNKSAIGPYDRQSSRGGINTFCSNVLLTTLGSIPPDVELMEQDMVEMDHVYYEHSADIGSLSTAIGGDDGEPIPDDESQRDGTPTPTYHSLEVGV